MEHCVLVLVYQNIRALEDLLFFWRKNAKLILLLPSMQASPCAGTDTRCGDPSSKSDGHKINTAILRTSQNIKSKGIL